MLPLQHQVVDVCYLSQLTLTKRTMEEVTEHLKDLRYVDDPERQKRIQYLQEICSSILAGPSNPKFRNLNRVEILQKLDNCQSALNILFDVGFVLSEDGERLKLGADELSINNIRKLHDALEAEKAHTTVQLSTICYCQQPLIEDISGSDLSRYKCRSCWESLSNSRFECTNESCIYKRISGQQFFVCSSCYQQDVYITFNDTDEGRNPIFEPKLRSILNVMS